MKAKHLHVPRTLREMVAEALRVAREPVLVVWSAYILLFPIYIFKSGLPQPGDLLIFALLPFALAHSPRLQPAARRPLRWLLIFTGYVIVINLFWSVALNKWAMNLKHGFFMSPIFYIYNALLFVTVLLLYRRFGARFLWLTVRLTLLSLFFQVVISFLYRTGSARDTLLFNSPNQLGYYALLSACILLLGQRRLGVSSLQVTVGLLMCSYLAFLSASKAALGSLGILVIAGVFNSLRSMLIAVAVFGALLVVSEPLVDAIHRTQSRIQNDENLGFFEERGYDRIVNNPEYWPFGSGEGGYDRFADTTLIGDHELHSSLGTLFFCYGLAGTLLFGAFLAAIVRGLGLRNTFLMLPALAYGMTHQGLRFTLLWVLLAMLIALKDIELQRKTARAELRAVQRRPLPQPAPTFRRAT